MIFHGKRRRGSFLGLLAFACSVVSGCASSPVTIGPRLPHEYRAVDRVRGGACGVLLFGVIPVGVNDRTERAYQQALAGRGRALADTQLEYSWYIIPAVGLLLCSDIEGKVVQ